jgi:uncharacterized protein involved in exopolysaccharide biosynthesis
MKNSKNRIEETESNFLAKIIFRFLPYWPVFAILFLLAGAGSWLYLRFTTPMYESTARLLIKDEKKGTENTKTLEDLNLISTKKIIENEMEVIQSRPLLNEVVRNLHLYAPVYEEGSIRRSSAYVTSPISIEVQNTEKIELVEKVEFTYDAKASKVFIANKSYGLNQWVTTPYGTLRFTPNKELSRTTNRKLYFSLVPTKSVAGDIQSRLEVKTTNKQASILNLVLKDEVPERGGDILNELLNTYNKTIIKDKNILAANTLAFVEERLRSVEHDLDSIERRTQQYKTRTGAIDVGEQGKLFLQNVSQNDQKLGEVNMQLAVLNQVKNYVQSKNSEAGIVPSTLGVSDPMLSQLITKLYTTEQEYEAMKKTTGEALPSMVALADQIDKMRPSILENIRSQEQSLLASRNNIFSTNGSYNSMLQTIPEKQRELIDINREQSIKNGIYAFSCKKGRKPHFPMRPQFRTAGWLIRLSHPRRPLVLKEKSFISQLYCLHYSQG